MSAIIEVEDLGKKYRVSKQQYVSFREVLTNIIKAPLTLGGTIGGGSHDDDFWALRDVNFSVEQGEVLGVIGGNGAGKSTLLKILSKITPPTTGQVTLRGRVGSLLEVGTGFHPELTGRENIFLNGAILGMRKKEIERKFDEIVDFSGVEKFLDTPVKRYSSGMYVRLAFAVAAHLEPEILLVDEVLAVGDVEFQKKCIGKMRDVTRQDGRTVLLVSHSMSSIRQLCRRSLLLANGTVAMHDDTEKVLEYYLNEYKGGSAIVEYPQDKKKPIHISKISVLSKKFEPAVRLPVNEKFFIRVEYDIAETQKNTLLSSIFFKDGELLLYSSAADKTEKVQTYEKGSYVTTIEIPSFLFNMGVYHFSIAFHSAVFDIERRDKLGFEIVGGDDPRAMVRSNYALGSMAQILDFDTHKL